MVWTVHHLVEEVPDWLIQPSGLNFRRYILVTANKMYSKLFCIFTLLKKIAYSSFNHNNNSSETSWSWSAWLTVSWKFTCNYAQVNIFYVPYVNPVIYSLYGNWKVQTHFQLLLFSVPRVCRLSWNFQNLSETWSISNRKATIT